MNYFNSFHETIRITKEFFGNPQRLKLKHYKVFRRPNQFAKTLIFSKQDIQVVNFWNFSNLSNWLNRFRKNSDFSKQAIPAETLKKF